MDEVIVGRHSVREALRSGHPLNKVYVAAGRTHGLDEIRSLARERGVPVCRVDRLYLDRLAPGVAHQGVAAVAAPYPYHELEDLLAGAGEPLLVVLDGVFDPRNLGSIVRVAEAAGVTGLVLPRRRTAGLTAAVAKAAAGALEYVRVARVGNPAVALRRLRERGLWVVGADPAAPRSLWDLALAGPLALVVGGEDRGLTKAVRAECDELLRIPMAGRITSLNVAVATAVVLYEVLRQRGRGRAL
ncbi:MAG: 23S rRNA (guanosine(2251)-2'-O)-methyltransferase RlmB [Firmicutes bacterium]|nr:23S rRNA (guanosine(2251)-2'-O)-methyltransferase RlmB [Bacillota bacterium]